MSRTFLYQNPRRPRPRGHGGQRLDDQASRAAQVEASWRERALNAEHALKLTRAEIAAHRTTIGQLLGKIRDLEHDLPDDGVQQLISENTTLKHQIRQLTEDSQRLRERLQGARDNNRFLDKRIADLETRLADQS